MPDTSLFPVAAASPILLSRLQLIRTENEALGTCRCLLLPPWQQPVRIAENEDACAP